MPKLVSAPRASRRHDGYMAVVELELDDRVSSNAECAAAALSRLPGARRVLYRLKDESGSVFSRYQLDPPGLGGVGQSDRPVLHGEWSRKSVRCASGYFGSGRLHMKSG